jgi:uncharacterized protein involved in exopolysaccharide biosynthesis
VGKTMPGSGVDAQISVRELAGTVWQGRWFVLIIVAAATLLAISAALFVTKKYQADLVISPVSSEQASSQLGALVSQFGGLASLAGISGAKDTKTSESLAVLQSEALTQAYIERNNLLPILFASKWDAARKQWRGSDPAKIPTLWRGNEYFGKNVRTVTTDAKTGLVTLSITWTDPVLAAKWANELVAYANEVLQSKAIREADRNIAYLNDEARKTEVVEVRQAIYSLLQTEINKAMLARGTDEYALKTIDPAFVPERPYFPNFIIWTLIGFLSGLFLSLSALFIRGSFGRRPE